MTVRSQTTFVFVLGSCVGEHCAGAVEHCFVQVCVGVHAIVHEFVDGKLFDTAANAAGVADADHDARLLVILPPGIRVGMRIDVYGLSLCHVLHNKKEALVEAVKVPGTFCWTCHWRNPM